MRVGCGFSCTPLDENVQGLFAFGLNPHILLMVPLSYARSSPLTQKVKCQQTPGATESQLCSREEQSQVAKGQELSGQKYCDLVL